MRVASWAIACPVLALGCNAILGIGDASLDPQEQGQGTVLNGGAPSNAEPAAGDRCSEEGTLVCGTPSDRSNERAVLSCDGGSYQQVFECPERQTCYDASSHTAVACGTSSVNLSYAKSGAPCAAEGAAACSFDAQIVLQCQGGTWIESRHCAPSRCAKKTVDGVAGLSCENGGYSEGDHCGFTAGKVVCSADLNAILICDGGVTTVKERCTGSKQCTLLAGGALGCG